jgi:hypothetical protein
MGCTSSSTTGGRLFSKGPLFSGKAAALDLTDRKQGDEVENNEERSIKSFIKVALLKNGKRPSDCLQDSAGEVINYYYVSLNIQLTSDPR